MEAVIRHATSQDAPALQEISIAGTKTLRSVYHPSNERAGRRKGADRTWLVAAVDHRVVGAMSYTTSEQALHLRGLGVLPSYQRHGVARLLVDYAVGLAASKELPGVTLETVRETGNVEIFERLGFSVISEARTDEFLSPEGLPMTDVVMRRPAV